MRSEPQNARDEASSVSNFYYTGRMLDVLGILIAGMGLCSLLWLKFFAFGPLEWLWPSLTYWQRQPFTYRAATPGHQA